MNNAFLSLYSNKGLSAFHPTVGLCPSRTQASELSEKLILSQWKVRILNDEMLPSEKETTSLAWNKGCLFVLGQGCQPLVHARAKPEDDGLRARVGSRHEPDTRDARVSFGRTLAGTSSCSLF